jgi:hypothetical protein
MRVGMPRRGFGRTVVLLSGIALVALAALRPWGAGAASPQPQDPGSLVRTTMQSNVGVVLDELPASMRSRVAASLVAKPASFWKDRAATQLRLTVYRLVFRQFFYSASRSALPLPPEPTWNITLTAPPTRRVVDGHDVVSVPYQFSSTLLSGVGEPGVSEPQLAKIGGTWDEPFILPIDPELVFQRTGYACMDEDSFPFNSVDSEEVDSFYDQTAVVERTLGNVGQSHFTRQPTESCVQALQNHVGSVVTSMHFERLPWSNAVANQVRFGPVTGNEPDLQIYLPDFLPSRTNYRYVHASGSGSCEVAEGSVTGTGWRRLLQFATSDENVGNQPLTIGGVDYTVSGHAGELDVHNLFELSPCHGHFHFKYYGDLGWSGNGTIANSKLGFCLQSTNRVANREGSPLHNRFAGCDFQGVEAGWVDQYKAGLPNQWLDTTLIKKGVGTRSFRSNPNGFLCEGTFVDANGNPLGPDDPVVWAPTGLIAENGGPVEAPLCTKIPTWADNNFHTTAETLETQGLGMITGACTRGQIGPLRNCGFGTAPKTVDCVPGRPTTATFSIKAGSAPQVVRLTEYSHALASPIPARFEDSWVPLQPGVSDRPAMLANLVVSGSTTVTFTCPSARTEGTAEPGGTYSIYTAPVFPDDPVVAVTRS